jgi:hypothetical protein
MLIPNRRKDGVPFVWMDEPPEIFTPNAIQIRGAVKKSDPNYRIRPRRLPFWLYVALRALAICLLVIGFFGALFIIAEAIGS